MNILNKEPHSGQASRTRGPQLAGMWHVTYFLKRPCVSTFALQYAGSWAHTHIPESPQHLRVTGTYNWRFLSESSNSQCRRERRPCLQRRVSMSMLPAPNDRRLVLQLLRRLPMQQELQTSPRQMVRDRLWERVGSRVKIRSR